MNDLAAGFPPKPWRVRFDVLRVQRVAVPRSGTAARPGKARDWQRILRAEREVSAIGSFASDELGALRDEREWVLVLLSRTLNVLAGGSPHELFCGRAYREAGVHSPLLLPRLPDYPAVAAALARA